MGREGGGGTGARKKNKDKKKIILILPRYIKNCSISYSFNRCITVHGTNNTVVSLIFLSFFPSDSFLSSSVFLLYFFHQSKVANNTCFNFIGHGYFLENGVETGNWFDGNLGIYAIRPPANEAILPSDIQQGIARYFQERLNVKSETSEF